MKRALTEVPRLSARPSPAPTHWQDLAGSYDAVMDRDPAMRDLHRLILEELPLSARQILDLGTGTGTLLQLLRTERAGCRLTGLDPAPAMLEEAAGKLGSLSDLSLVEGSADELDLPSASYDAVVSNFALHHLTHGGKRSCAFEVYRVLRPGGWFIFGDQHCPSMGTPEDPAWVRQMLDHFTAKARHYLETAGPGRMLLQVRLLPRMLTADGEIPATVDFWLEALRDAGFVNLRVRSTEPEFLLHRVIAARKPSEREKD